MFRSLHMKLVLIMLLLITSLMAVVGAFLITSVTNFYIDDFYAQMSETFSESNADFVNSMRAEAAQEGGVAVIQSMLETYSGALGIDSRNRNYYILDASSGEFLAGSDEQGGRNLSGGQKQRLSIARALVKKPEVLILDDSSSALDFATDAALRHSIRNLGYPVTTFLVSQRIACIRQADQILVLDNGRAAGCGTHEALLENCTLYQEIFDSQFPGERLAAKEGRAQ